MFNLDLLAPLSMVDENMKRAHDVNAVRTQRNQIVDLDFVYLMFIGEWIDSRVSCGCCHFRIIAFQGLS